MIKLNMTAPCEYVGDRLTLKLWSGRELNGFIYFVNFYILTQSKYALNFFVSGKSCLTVNIFCGCLQHRWQTGSHTF